MYEEKKINEFLFSLRNKGSNYEINTMKELIKAMGSPHKQFRAIHVAGTNGKGSVCAMLEAIYRGNGYKTGLYTSPHLTKLNERMQINRININDVSVEKYTNQIKNISTKLNRKNILKRFPSFFEFITVMAFKYFADNKVDIAIIETGIGGRLDATNILLPELSVITNIGLEHTEILGETIEEVTHEKAGIIKKGCPIIIGDLPKKSKSIVVKRAKELNAKLYSLMNRFSPNSLPETNLVGQYQKHNAGIASLTSEILAIKFPVKDLSPLLYVDWPGRWQRIPLKNTSIILDATHNLNAFKQLEENIKKLIIKSKCLPIIIVGIVGINRAKDLIPLLTNYTNSIYLVKVDQPNACEIKKLRGLIPNKFKGEIFESKLEDLFSKNYCNIKSNNPIIITGSIYLIGQTLSVINKLEPDPIGQDIFPC